MKKGHGTIGPSPDYTAVITIPVHMSNLENL